MRTALGQLLVGVGIVLGSAAAAAAGAPVPAAPPVPNRPGATLLLPYFEVDLDNVSGATTLFSVNNSSATAILAHVVIWSDMGVPVFGYNIYLTGYDVQTINVRDVLNGTVSRTASDGQDFTDTISPQGLLSQDINFASCNGQLPPPAVPAVYQPYLRSALTGGPSSFHGGKCVARNLGTPGIARGYITVDTVNNCTLRLPGDVGYFSSDITYQNVLWGDYTYINPSLDLAYGDALVHVAANLTDPETTVAGQYTFYGRLVHWDASDHREPLATSFAARFVAPKDFKTAAKARRRPFLPPSTELVVWRDSKVAPDAFTCGTTPSWFPLQQEQIRAFDEQEQSEVPAFSAPPFPGMTQRVALANAAFPLTAYSGWLFLDLNTAIAGNPNPSEDAAAAQAWVTILQRVQQGPNGGRYDVGFRAIRLDSAETASHATIF
jgi:hypothetical protein